MSTISSNLMIGKAFPLRPIKKTLTRPPLIILSFSSAATSPHKKMNLMSLENGKNKHIFQDTSFLPRKKRLARQSFQAKLHRNFRLRLQTMNLLLFQQKFQRFLRQKQTPLFLPKSLLSLIQKSISRFRLTILRRHSLIHSRLTRLRISCRRLLLLQILSRHRLCHRIFSDLVALLLVLLFHWTRQYCSRLLANNAFFFLLQFLITLTLGS